MEITKELLKQKFEEYNKLYFNNELPMCTFSYNYMRFAFGLYTIRTRYKERKVGHIRISKSIDLDEEMLRQLLVHEMIHHYVHFIDGVSFDGFFSHGRHFVRQIKRIKKEHGLEILVCYPDWYFRKEKPNTSLSLKVITFLRNNLHLF